MPPKPFRVFLSSTYLDLVDHRSSVIDAIRKAGLIVDPMEDWTADPAEPTTFSTARIEGCELFVLLVAMRRGFVPSGTTKSITQLEYEEARSRGLDCLVFLLDDASPWVRDWDELEADAELRRWRAQLLLDHGISRFFLDPNSVEIGPALTRWVRERSELDRISVDLALAGVTKQSLISPDGSRRIDLSEVATLIDDLRHLVVTLSSEKYADAQAESEMQLANALAAARSWTEAVDHYDNALSARPDDWELNLLCAVARANSRLGGDSDLAALRRYNDAIALQPPYLDLNLRARLHSYRGAMHKRLGRLDEAEADCRIALRWATATYERSDASYNLACVYALQGRRDDLVEVIETMNDDWRRVLVGSPYLREFESDDQVMNLILPPG